MKSTYFFSAILGVGFSAACAGSGVSSVALVDGGAPKACLVVSADAPRYETHLAAEVVRWTKELTGAELPVGASAADGLTPVTFRLTDDKTVEEEGFRISASAKGVEIAARRPFGLACAVYWMLNRWGGIYWCDPESGVDFTKTDRFAVPDGVTVRNPMPGRCPLAAGLPGPEVTRKVAEWNVRNGFRPRVANDSDIALDNGVAPHVEIAGSLGDRLWKSETNEVEIAAEIARLKATGEDKTRCRNLEPRTLRYVAQTLLQMKKHPERFPLVNGKRCPTGTEFLHGYLKGERVSNCCLTSPSTREFLLAELKAQRAKAPKDAIVTYGFGCDDNSQWCECPNCLKLLKSPGNSSADDRACDLWWDFINWISPRLLENDPNARVEVLIYLTYRQVPKKVKPLCCDRDRMCVLVCPHGRCHLHSLADASCPANPRFLKMIREWADLGFRTHTFEYHCQLPGKGNYAFIERPWVEDLKWYRDHRVSHTSGGLWGVWGGYPRHPLLSKKPIYEFGAKSRWQIIWLSGYFEWDPDDDFETVRTRLLTAYYRAAAPEMLAYHALLEKAIFDTNICMCYGSSALPFTVAASEPGLLEEAKALLQKAEAKAKDDPELLRRITRDRQSLVRDWESMANLAAGQKARRIFRATDRVAVDGVLDEATWKGATLSDDYRWQKTYNVDEAQTEPYRPKTFHKVAFDNESLYLAVVCEKVNGKTRDEPGEGSVWDAMEGSHLEFCLMSPALNGLYYHFAISHNGKVYSALTTNPNLRDLKKPLEFTHAIKDEPNRWTVEIAIPLANVNVPKPGEVWKLSVNRFAVGADGSIVTGLSTGFPLHWIDRWEPISFGPAGDLCENGSFEFGMPAPVGNPHQGRNWKFVTAEIPSLWYYHHNGGEAEWMTGDAADGERYLRVKPINSYGGPEFVVTKNFTLYPPSTKSFKVSFAARGEGVLKLYHYNVKDLPEVDVMLDSPKDWKRYEVDMNLNGTHPIALVFRLVSPVAKSAIDLDDISIVPKR